MKTSTDISTINPDFDPSIDVTGAYQKGIVEPLYRRPLKHDLKILQTLVDQIDDGKLIHNFFPKQSDIDKLMKQIKRKLLDNSTCLPTLNIFKLHIYEALISSMYICIYSKTKCLYRERAMRKLEAVSQNYMILNTLLFKVI